MTNAISLSIAPTDTAIATQMKRKPNAFRISTEDSIVLKKTIQLLYQAFTKQEITHQNSHNMDKPSPIKDILYKTLEAISEEKIQQNISKNNIKSLIQEILSISKIETLSGNKTENYEAFAESLMHYILTNTLITSQRKITHTGVEIDIVIPDIRTLNSSSKDAIIIFFPKTDDVISIQQRLEKISTVQPIKENIWLIQRASLGLPYKTYELEGNQTFVNIIDDIRKTTSNNIQSKFKIFKV